MKAKKPKKDKPPRGKYDSKLVVEGNFMDIINASVKHADKQSEAKKPDN